jgi:amino acid adenylation domain-containing protein
VRAPHSLDSIVSNWAHRTPQAIAVIADDTSLSYRQLEQRANQLARRLLRAGAAPGTGVGLLMSRSAEFVVSVLAVLKVGAYYVPLSAALPAGQIQTMLRDNAIQIVLTHSSVSGTGQLPVKHRVLLDEEQPFIDRESSAPLTFPADPERIAYVMYTSGSTGRPKGVAIAHRGVLGLGDAAYLDIRPGERFLLHSSLLFDASTFELWVPLLNGATVVVADTGELSLTQLVRTIERYNVTTALFTTSLFHHLVRFGFNAIGGLRNLLFGGEVAAPTLVSQAARQWPHARLIHCYGPTECSVVTTCHGVTIARDQQVPLGKPITGRYIRILTDDLQLVPSGTTGELCVGGTCLAVGYVNQPEATATAFVRDPFSAEPDAQLYRTGDLVVQTLDGNLLFQGRKDAQTKIRGFRVEPAEIEHILRCHPQIEDAVVVKHVADEQLVAYLVRPQSRPLNVGELRAFLAAHVPRHLIPSRFTTIDQIPLNSSGKTDRATLSRMTASEIRREPHQPRRSRGGVEDELTAIWRRILGIDAVSPDADFFLLGGHSLQVLELIETLARTYGVVLDVEDFLENPTIAALQTTITAQLRTAQRV